MTANETVKANIYCKIASETSFLGKPAPVGWIYKIEFLNLADGVHSTLRHDGTFSSDVE